MSQEIKENDIELDVRSLPHARRHDTIFSLLEKLESKQALVITNDHDPRPLGFQMRALYGDETYSWTYIESGPEVWRVAIRKEA